MDQGDKAGSGGGPGTGGSLRGIPMQQVYWGTVGFEGQLYRGVLKQSCQEKVSKR